MAMKQANNSQIYILQKKTLFLARYGNTAFDYSDSFIVDPDWSKGSFHHG